MLNRAATHSPLIRVHPWLKSTSVSKVFLFEGPYFIRCRTASYKQTPAETETFKQSTVPAIGMLMR